MSSTIWPGSVINGGVVPALTAKNGGTAAAPTEYAPTAPANTTAKTSVAVAPATPNTTSGNNSLVSVPSAGAPGTSAYTLVDGVRAAINKFFGIVSNTPGGGQ